jgi:outer membrane protein TolC
LLRARRTAKQIELDKEQLADDIAGLSAHLSHLIGFPVSSFASVPDSIPALPSIATLVESSAPSGRSDTFALQSADANARSKQELAFGEHRYLLRPQISLAVNYSRIDTGQNDYTTYYPNFKSKSENAASVYFQITIPIYDRRHQEESREASAEASRATFEAAVQRNQFLESRFKLQHSATEIATRAELAEIDRDLAEEQLNTVLIQLQSGAQPAGATVMSPEDEQNARLQERQRYIDLLSTQFELQQAQVNLLRQTGGLDDWLKRALAATANPSPSVQAAPPTSP